MMDDTPTFSVSDAIAVINQTLEYAYPSIVVIGEVTNFKISGGKWVFFDIKDEQSSMKCFMTAWSLRTAISDGMIVQVVAQPRLGKYGFSLNVNAIKPVGEGSIRKSFELLRSKLEAEGLFAQERKRLLTDLPSRVGVISSTQAAGYRDFLKITEERFGGMEILVSDVTVQGDSAPDQIIESIKFFNEMPIPPEVIVIIRGGGSRDDLVAFDDELLVREIAGSRVPTLVGVGHEIDITLADLAADVRASTPSNAAEILVPDKREIITDLDARLMQLMIRTENNLDRVLDRIVDDQESMQSKLGVLVDKIENRLGHLSTTLKHLNPKTVLNRGYSIVRTDNNKILATIPKSGDELIIENSFAIINANVTKAEEK